MTVLDVILWIPQSWKNVEISIIEKCFHKAGFCMSNVPITANTKETNASCIPDFDDKILQEYPKLVKHCQYQRN